MHMHRKIRIASTTIATATLVALLAPSPVVATHPAGGTCKHTGGLYSLCKTGARNKKCTIGGKSGKCVQKAAGCICEAGRSARLQAAVTDLREAFDVILTSADLPPAVVPVALACQQVTTLTAHMANAVPLLGDFANDPEFVGTALLGQVDSLLRDIQQVEAVALSCADALPAGLQAALLTLKGSYLATFADALE